MPRNCKRDKDLFTPDDIRAAFSYDPATGAICRIASRFPNRIGPVPTTPTRPGYLQVSLRGRIVKAHRIAWVLMTGKWPDDQVDHINGIRSDNRWCNLRECTQAMNGQNMRIGSNNSSGLLGASPYGKGKWIAAIGVNGKSIHLGYFKTKEEAHAAYLAAKAKYHGFQPQPRETAHTKPRPPNRPARGDSP